MTFWEQYKLYLKDQSLGTLSVSTAGLLTSLVIKWWTGSHYILDIEMNGMSMPRFLVVHSIGTLIGLFIFSAISVYLERKYSKEEERE